MAATEEHSLTFTLWGISSVENALNRSFSERRKAIILKLVMQIRISVSYYWSGYNQVSDTGSGEPLVHISVFFSETKDDISVSYYWSGYNQVSNTGSGEPLVTYINIF